MSTLQWDLSSFSSFIHRFKRPTASMASHSVVSSTSISLLISRTTSFSTIYQTSRPVVIATITSAATHLTTLTQPEVVMASTLAFPTTITKTISNVLTTYATAPPPAATAIPPATSTKTITSTATVTSIVIQPGGTITYYRPTPTFVLTPPPICTVIQPTSTVTLTELILLLENPAGQVYSTITTILPFQATQTTPIVFVPGGNHHNGWDSWSDAQQGGLIAGVVILFLIILATVAFCLLRRRNIWLANEWAEPPAPMIMQPQMAGAVVPYQAQQGYWGYGPAGWGFRN